MQELRPSELAELQAAFADVLNYESEDPTDPINPLVYVAPDGDTCLHVAARRGNLRAVELLVKAGLNIDEPGDMGFTPLHCASKPEIIAFLVASGASTEIKNEFGQLPIKSDE
jgi:ankyrin repeat protein